MVRSRWSLNVVKKLTIIEVSSTGDLHNAKLHQYSFISQNR